jgi:UDP-N-acetyl-D-glucosamine dehydrogenase
MIGIIGLGYVGLPLARVFALAGHQVLGFDVDPNKITTLAEGKNYLQHLGKDYVREINDTGRFEATDDFSRLAEPDAIFICVPTPLGEHLEPDLSYVEKTGAAIAATLRAGQLVVLESTTYPGTSREILLPQFEATGLKLGSDFFVAYSPEREDPGRKDHNTQSIPKLVGGLDKESGRRAAELYRSALDEVIEVGSAEVAEAAKLLENIYRAVNIALVNELKRVFTAIDLDVWEVIDAAATKPFGFQAFYPGPGLGGHCIPIDPFYLTWKAREAGLSTRFIELAGEVNRAMPEYVVDRTVWALGQRGKAIKNAKILVLGIAYKPNVDDTRESPGMELIERLLDLNADVHYNDPHVPKTLPMRKHDLKMISVDLTPDSIAEFDCLVIATNHSVYDAQVLVDHAQLIVDTRGMLRGFEEQNIVQA